MTEKEHDENTVENQKWESLFFLWKGTPGVYLCIRGRNGFFSGNRTGNMEMDTQNG